MYAQQYEKEKTKINVPNNYSGNALFESIDIKEENERTDESVFPNESHNREHSQDFSDSEVLARPKEKSAISSLLKNLPFGNMFGGVDLFKGGKIKFGSEEIIIIAIALFLIFTAGADKELGLMLLLLLFIS